MGAIPTIPAAYTVGQRWTRKAAAAHATALNFLLSPPRCEAVHHTVISPATATWAVVPFDTETYDTDSMHDLVTNTSRVTAQTPGRYEITAVVSFAGNATGDRRAQIRQNAAGAIGGGTQVSQLAAHPAAVGASVLTTVELPARDIYLNAGDYVELFVWQNSGGALALTADAPNTYLRARWVSNS